MHGSGLASIYVLTGWVLWRRLQLLIVIQMETKLSSEKGQVCEFESWLTQFSTPTEHLFSTQPTGLAPSETCLKTYSVYWIPLIIFQTRLWILFGRQNVTCWGNERVKTSLQRETMRNSFRGSSTNLHNTSTQNEDVYLVCGAYGVILTPSWLLFASTAALLLPVSLLLASQQEKCTVVSNPYLYWLQLIG